MSVAVAAASFVVVNLALSVAVVLCWRLLPARRRSAGNLFGIRMIPAAGSIVVTLGLIVPSFLMFEPAATSERAEPELALFTALAAALIATGLVRALGAWLATRRLERLWASQSTEGEPIGAVARVHRVPSDLPFAALIGLVKPRVFVSGRFLEALTPGERIAVLEHEAGHARSRDNLKRTLMRLAPDCILLLPGGAAIDAAWAAAAEDEADDHAAGPDRAHALDLAGALLKAVRSVPVPSSPASNLCDQATIARRVARLLDSPRPGNPAGRTALFRILWLAVALGAAVVLAQPTFRIAYEMTETAVRLFQ